MPLDAYTEQARRTGGIVEELISGVEVRSPSVQLRVLPSGEVELLSTHDQLLGGPSGQSYLGCAVPGRLRLRAGDLRRGRRTSVTGWPARASSAGSPSTSSSCATSRRTWTPYAIEINLRKGGTTHPFLTLQFLTDGRYDPATGLFLTPNGRGEASGRHRPPRVADACAALPLDDLFDIVARHGLHFDQSRQTGVVFHMMSCLTEGRIGMTAVGDSPADAQKAYRRAEQILLDEARAALSDGPPLG